MPAVTVGDATIPYRLRRSARAKRLRLVVAPGRVEVVAPLRMAPARIEAFVQSRRAWLYRKTEALRDGRPGALPERFVDGAEVLVGGRRQRLRIEPADVTRTRLRYADGFHLRVPQGLDSGERESVARARVVRWLRERARQEAGTLIDRYGPALGVWPSRLRIGDQRTLWGSCSSRGVISLNYRLVAAPESILEYVVVHELCHLRERNHGPRFWRLVEELLPDFAERRAWLKKHGVALG